MSAFTPTGGSGGIPITTSSDGATNPVVANVPMATAATEYSYVLPADTRQYSIKLRSGPGLLQLAHVAAQSGTNYQTIPRYCFLSDSDLKLTGPITLYFQSDLAAQVAEIRYWT